MNIRLIDSTLREGLQSSGQPIFASELDMETYVGAVSRMNIIDRFELFRPSAYGSEEKWPDLACAAGDVQLYIGPSHKFINEPLPQIHLKSLIASTTLVRKSRQEISAIRDISEQMGGIKLRVGIECAGSIAIAETVSLLAILTEIPEVTVVSLNDSNASMTEGWLEQLFIAIAKGESNLVDHLGFHLHNGVLSAVTKAKKILELARDVDLKELEFDVTAYGLGDNRGVLSIADALKTVQTNNYKGPDRSQIFDYGIGSSLIDPFRVYASPASHSATSHYTESGELRTEYK